MKRVFLTFLRRIFPGHARPRPSPPPPSFRPALEVLEGRYVLGQVLNPALAAGGLAAAALIADAAPAAAPSDQIQIIYTAAAFVEPATEAPVGRRSESDAAPPPADSAPPARSDAGPDSTPDSAAEKRPDVSADEMPPPDERRDAGLAHSPLGDALADNALPDVLPRSSESSGGSAPVAAVTASHPSEGNSAASGAGSAPGASPSEPPPLPTNATGPDAQTRMAMLTGTSTNAAPAVNATTLTVPPTAANGGLAAIDPASSASRAAASAAPSPSSPTAMATQTPISID